jgi:PIN domain nuclease of toxin-antitoxin system
MGTRITLDSHALIWYIYEESNPMLTDKALDAIREAVKYGIIYVPTIALLEILRLIEKGKYPISFSELINTLKRNEAFEIVPLTIEVVEVVEELQNLELHDRVIVATAVVMDTYLVTKDLEISKVYDRVIW